MRTSFSKLPLTGVKVVDFGQYIAGPAVAMLLGDLGATVIHIDPLGGPMWQSEVRHVTSAAPSMSTESTSLCCKMHLTLKTTFSSVLTHGCAPGKPSLEPRKRPT